MIVNSLHMLVIQPHLLAACGSVVGFSNFGKNLFLHKLNPKMKIAIMDSEFL